MTTPIIYRTSDRSPEFPCWLKLHDGRWYHANQEPLGSWTKSNATHWSSDGPKPDVPPETSASEIDDPRRVPVKSGPATAHANSHRVEWDECGPLKPAPQTETAGSAPDIEGAFGIPKQFHEWLGGLGLKVVRNDASPTTPDAARIAGELEDEKKSSDTMFNAIHGKGGYIEITAALRSQLEEARKNIGPSNFGFKDGVYNICVGYHPATAERPEQWEWLEVVPRLASSPAPESVVKAAEELNKFYLGHPTIDPEVVAILKKHFK